MLNDDDLFYQACALPFRPAEDSWEFCLVTSRKTKEWSFPKGTIKQGETPEATALKNARKEVGVHGDILRKLGKYQYRKWETTLEVTVFLMQVHRCDEQWEQSSKRDRRWTNVEEALSLLSRYELKQLLEKAHSWLLEQRS